MERANEPIKLYSGNGILSKNEVEFEFSECTIYFEWGHKIGPKVEMTEDYHLIDHTKIDSRGPYKLKIDGLVVGTVLLYETLSFDNFICRGILDDNPVLGDRSINTASIKFIVPNFIPYIGELTVWNHEDSKTVDTTRLVLSNEDYSVVFDQVTRPIPTYDSLRDLGGHIKMLDGEICKHSGESISYDECTKIIQKLHIFLSFVNGSKTAPLLITGWHNDKPKWIDMSNRISQSYKYCYKWVNESSIKSTTKLWREFSALAKNDEDLHVLDRVIHWYTESNNSNSGVDASIILSQAALELLYNYVVVERLQILDGKDAESLSASGKIKLLLSTIDNIDYHDYGAYHEVETYVNKNRPLNNAIDFCVSMRNALVHSQLSKRDQLNSLPIVLKQQAAEILLYYTERAILNLLLFKGSYGSRIHKRLDVIS